MHERTSHNEDTLTTFTTKHSTVDQENKFKPNNKKRITKTQNQKRLGDHNIPTNTIRVGNYREPKLP